MLFSLASGALTALALVQQIDTTVPAQQGQRLVVDSYGGEIDVKTWGRNAVRVEADPSSRTSGRDRRARSGAVSVRTEGRRGPPSAVDLTITVPVWMGLDLSGVYTDVKVVGVRAPDHGGDRPGRGGRDRRRGTGVAALGPGPRSSLKGAKGRIDVHSVNEDVRVSDASGEIVAETVNGEIVLERVDATSLDAGTVNGDVGYDGPIRSGGRYTLSSHNGDVTLAVAGRRQRDGLGQHVQRRVRVGVPGDASGDPEGQAVQLHPGRRERPGVTRVVPGNGPAGAAGPPRRGRIGTTATTTTTTDR